MFLDDKESRRERMGNRERRKNESSCKGFRFSYFDLKNKTKQNS